MSKIVAIYEGGDWADANCKHYVIPEQMDLSKEQEKQREWYSTYKSGRDEYVSFEDRLLANGARKTTENEVTEFWNDA